MQKTALITGATSGIGEAATRRFIADGWRVIGTGRRKERLDTLTAELSSDQFYALPVDVRDSAGMEAALANLPASFARIDLLINNAGLALGTAPAQQSNIDDWQTMIDTNIKALVDITRRLLPVLIEQKGAIINLSSTAASYPYVGGNVYGGTKAFVRQFSLGLRADLHGTGVRVTSVEPGMVETEFTLVRTNGNADASDKLYAGSHPMTATDIADTLFWIASQPAHLNVNTIELMPVSQSFAGFQVDRKVS